MAFLVKLYFCTQHKDIHEGEVLTTSLTKALKNSLLKHLKRDINKDVAEKIKEMEQNHELLPAPASQKKRFARLLLSEISD